MINQHFGGGGTEPITREAIRRNSAGLTRDVQSKIGQQLRATYDDVLSEGVPDRFVELLNRLDHKRDAPCPDATATADNARAPVA